ncbi:metalloregulator ArsR/SmtB family transcription factor [Sporolactobacillus sp. STCC-11]|uniref:ArsR/SmtB family transcription factor n=1 Tax=Sporolactobacillus caesalpiniae TaxID=3230362 RepID=UPI0033942FBC
MFAHLEQWMIKHVEAVYSPYRELMTSLHVLTKPEHHLDRLEWANRTRQSLSSEMLNTLSFFGKVTDEWMFIMDCERSFGFENRYVEDSIEQWNHIDCEAFASFLLGTRRNLDRIQLNPDEREILRRPKRYQKMFYHFLHDYHTTVFARELYHIEPWMIRSVNQFNEEVQKDPIGALRSVHPRFIVGDQSVQFLKARTYTRSYEDLRSITIIPSTFIAPHLLIDIDTPDLFVAKQLLVPSHDLQEGVPTDLTDKLKALSDPTRMRMARLMLYNPYCTQQLSDHLSLAKATVSKHLRILEDAGLIESRRSSHYVFYKTKARELEMIRVDMDQFFDRPKLR